MTDITEKIMRAMDKRPVVPNLINPQVGWGQIRQLNLNPGVTFSTIPSQSQYLKASTIAAK
jgi:hypothetical protein